MDTLLSVGYFASIVVVVIIIIRAKLHVAIETVDICTIIIQCIGFAISRRIKTICRRAADVSASHSNLPTSLRRSV